MLNLTEMEVSDVLCKRVWKPSDDESSESENELVTDELKSFAQSKQKVAKKLKDC